MHSLGKVSAVHAVAGISAEASGPSYSVPRLCEALGALGHEIKLLTLGTEPTRAGVNYSHRAYPTARFLSRLGASAQLRDALTNAVRTADLVHNHGLWLMPNIYSADAARRWRKPLIITPRGTLSPVALKISWLRKKVFWSLLQSRAMRSAACLHATSEQEYRDIRRFGLRQPVAIVPNGVDIPAETAKLERSGLRTLLYLGRIHPIKGLDNLLRAWRQVAQQYRDWQLRLVGPDSAGYQTKLERLANELQLPRVVFAGPRYGADKQAEYAAADLFVLPSHSENFGMSAAEALAQGIPIVTTTGTPWEEVSKHGCGWVVAPDAASLESALRQALALDHPTLQGMGRAGQDWMKLEFSWERIARDFEKVYRWLLHGGPAPAFIRFD